MRLILITGLMTSLGTVASPPMGDEPKRPANRIGHPEGQVSQAAKEVTPSLGKPSRGAVPPEPVCAIRVARADPKVDPGMAQGTGRDVDSRMVVPSHCRK